MQAQMVVSAVTGGYHGQGGSQKGALHCTALHKNKICSVHGTPQVWDVEAQCGPHKQRLKNGEALQWGCRVQHWDQARSAKV